MTWAIQSDRMLRTCLAAFGEQVQYKRGAAVTIISKAVFDANYQAVDPNTGAIITSTNPMIGVRLADLPGGATQDGDEIIRKGVTYRVIEQQDDSEGHARLILHRKP